MGNVQALANYVPAAWRAYQHLEQIQSLQQRAQPHIQALLALAPEAQRLYTAIFPDAPRPQPAVGAPRPDLPLQPPAPKRIGISVKHLQEMLNHFGANLKVDGDYGQATHAAIKKYQQDNGLEPDGWAGTITLHHLYKRIQNEAEAKK
jgi:peptidoglycan hydrolase-like protein with peptidoglycan-binding domain